MINIFSKKISILMFFFFLLSDIFGSKAAPAIAGAAFDPKISDNKKKKNIKIEIFLEKIFIIFILI